MALNEKTVFTVDKLSFESRPLAVLCNLAMVLGLDYHKVGTLSALADNLATDEAIDEAIKMLKEYKKEKVDVGSI